MINVIHLSAAAPLEYRQKFGEVEKPHFWGFLAIF